MIQEVPGAVLDLTSPLEDELNTGKRSVGLPRDALSQWSVWGEQDLGSNVVHLWGPVVLMSSYGATTPSATPHHTSTQLTLLAEVSTDHSCKEQLQGEVFAG